jgi:hypothetical protein
MKLPTCHNCDSFVTPTFARVFGNNEGEVFSCPDCTPFRALVRGASANSNL